MKRALFAGLMIAGLFSSAAFAGPQYVDETGYAVSGYDVVAYHDLKQAPVGGKQPEAVPGSTRHVVKYNGAKWVFSTAENAKKFKADPARYAPLYDGHCAYGVAKGGKVPANPNLWRIVDGKLYLNITPGVVASWEKDIPGAIATANRKWSKKKKAAASRKSWKRIKANKSTYSTPAPVTN